MDKLKMTSEQIEKFIKTLYTLYAQQLNLEVKFTLKKEDID